MPEYDSIEWTQDDFRKTLRQYSVEQSKACDRTSDSRAFYFTSLALAVGAAQELIRENNSAGCAYLIGSAVCVGLGRVLGKFAKRNKQKASELEKNLVDEATKGLKPTRVVSL